MASTDRARLTFFDLPAELRNMTYRELADGESAIAVANEVGADYRWRTLAIDTLWHICPDFQHEFGAIFFGRDVWQQLHFHFTITCLETQLGWNCLQREVFAQFRRNLRICTLNMPPRMLNFPEAVVQECEGILTFVNKLERVEKLWLELDFRCVSDFTHCLRKRNTLAEFYPTERLWRWATRTMHLRQATFLQLCQVGQPRLEDIMNPTWRWPDSLKEIQVWIHGIRRVHRQKMLDPRTHLDDWRQAKFEDGRPCEETRDWRLHWHRARLREVFGDSFT